MEVTCVGCGKSFDVIPYRADKARYCSRSCRFSHLPAYNKGPKVRVEKQCMVCGGIFFVIPYRQKRALFCSIKCRSEGAIGKKRPRPPRIGYKIVRGYKLIFKPNHPDTTILNPYIKEHRLVVEHHLKRRLTNQEVVHHINENKLDNRIENLLVLDNRIHAIIHTRHLRKKSDLLDLLSTQDLKQKFLTENPHCPERILVET